LPAPKAWDCADHRFLGRDYSRELRLAEWGPTVILRGNNPQDRMSALGQKQTSGQVGVMSALPPKADIGTQSGNVRFVPKADKVHRSKMPS